jgi:hypothetical protein
VRNNSGLQALPAIAIGQLGRLGVQIAFPQHDRTAPGGFRTESRAPMLELRNQVNGRRIPDMVAVT